MKTLGLISGGKDSAYNMLLSQQRFGHEIVALGNLRPQNDDVQELDSYMYQTVGHNVVDAYAACMDLPLFVRRIRGTSINCSKVYDGTTEGDEVEDLRALLTYAKSRMPEIEAVSCGAIRSDYQRVRVESICQTLGLTCLAYLWRQPQDALLERMIEDGIDAVLIKVACLGLVPRLHLGKSLSDMLPKLRELNDMYGGKYGTV